MSQKSRPRHVRRRVYSRLRHGVSNILKQFLTTESARLTSSASLSTFTVDAGTDLVTASSHGFVNAEGPVELTNSGGALPAGLVVDTHYWVLLVDANTFRLCDRLYKVASSSYVDITGTGSGTHSVAFGVTPEALLERLRQGTDPETMRAETDIDDL